LGEGTVVPHIDYGYGGVGFGCFLGGEEEVRESGSGEALEGVDGGHVGEVPGTWDVEVDGVGGV
jgi:hypothetical protein